MDRARHLLRSSAIVVLLLGLGKLTGLVRARMVSAEFGTGTAYDAFTAANQLPEVFVTLISGGALAAAFIPVYSAYLTSQRSKQAAQLAGSILTLVIAVLGAISALGIVLAPWLVRHVLVPDFSPEQQALTASLMRVILLQTTLFGISGVLSSILNAHQHFALPAFAPVALDLGYFYGLVVLVPDMGIAGLAWGTVLGGVLHIVIQLPALVYYRFRYLPQIVVSLSGVREVIRLMVPRIVTLGSVQIADLFIIRLASGLAAGSTSAYFIGYQLMQLPETLLGTAIALVVFPTLAELYNAGDIDGLKTVSMNALRIIWTLTFPAAVGLVLLGQPAIQFLLEEGAFTDESTRLVYGILLFFSFRVVAESTLEILARLFYAQHDTQTPMFVALGWLALNVILAFPLADAYGARGLALASTIAFSLQSLALYLLNRRRLGYLHERELLATAGRSLLGAAGMSAVILLLEKIIDGSFLFLFAGGAAGLLAYLLVTYLAGAREIPQLIRIIRSRSENV
ncbi:MAG: murein biosynthesis integral membrane protein MurJ [Chloroflexota bacterium]|jgi:putative peptidoglycan lipid II flippase